MILRDSVVVEAPPQALRLMGPANWTAVVFFGILSFLHFSISLPAFYHSRWEGYLSFVLAIIFAGASVIAYFARYELALLPIDRHIRLRSGFGPLKFTRFIPFGDVHAVRLTLSRSGRSSESSIFILCDNEDIECPATGIPRQQALFLAVTMNVQLIKVTDDAAGEASDRAI